MLRPCRHPRTFDVRSEQPGPMGQLVGVQGSDQGINFPEASEPVLQQCRRVDRREVDTLAAETRDVWGQPARKILAGLGIFTGQGSRSGEEGCRGGVTAGVGDEEGPDARVDVVVLAFGPAVSLADPDQPATIVHTVCRRVHDHAVHGDRDDRTDGAGKVHLAAWAARAAAIAAAPAVAPDAVHYVRQELPATPVPAADPAVVAVVAAGAHGDRA